MMEKGDNQRLIKKVAAVSSQAHYSRQVGEVADFQSLLKGLTV